MFINIMRLIMNFYFIISLLHLRLFFVCWVGIQWWCLWWVSDVVVEDYLSRCHACHGGWRSCCCVGWVTALHSYVRTRDRHQVALVVLVVTALANHHHLHHCPNPHCLFPSGPAASSPSAVTHGSCWSDLHIPVNIEQKYRSKYVGNSDENYIRLKD